MAFALLMELLILALALGTFLSTLLGGVVILRFQKSLPYFFSFAAGSLIAVAFLDILPEAIKLSNSIGFEVRYLFIAVVLSFFLYNLIDRYFVTHCVGEVCETHNHVMGPIGAGSLVVHSFLDGVAIGTAFQLNASVGLLVALAVILHDFTDGINTVTLMLKGKQKRKYAVLLLVLDALAPLLGVAIIYFFSLPEKALILILGVFVGEFIFLGAANLLPETRSYDSNKTVLAMGLGILLILFLTSVV